MKKYSVIFFIITFSFLSSYGFGLSQEEAVQNPLIQQGINYYKAGDYDSAVRVLEEAIKMSVRQNELFTAYIYIGYTYFTLAELDKAVPYIDEAIKINPNKILDRNEFVSEFIDYYNDTKKTTVGIGFFESIPDGSFLYVDKIKLGITPLKQEFLAGKYMLRLVKWGYAPYEDEIEINRNEINNFKIDLSKTKNWKTFARSSVIVIAIAFLLKSI